MKRLRGRVVVVTGAGSGIGRATATAFGRLGAKLHVVDVDAQRLESVTRGLRAEGVEVHAHEVDVRDASAVERLADAVYDVHGRVDVLVNNAGVGHSGAVADTSLEDWKWVLDVNLWGVIHGVHAFVPRLIAQGGDAHVVNVASLAGLVGMPEMGPYCASKFAVVGLSESLGAELAPLGIDVSVICPGLVKTGIVGSSRLRGRAAARQGQIGAFYERHGITPESVAERIVTAVKTRRPVTLTSALDKVLVMMRQVSPSLFRRAAGKVQQRIVEGR